MATISESTQILGAVKFSAAGFLVDFLELIVVSESKFSVELKSSI